MEKKHIRTRIAPSPTGSPHIGTVYAALFNYCFTRADNGDFVLRIEDTDRTRFVEGSEQEIFDALEWVGLKPDESPLQGGKFAPYRQSERLEIYKQHVEKLIADGKAYYCDCSPERLEKLREEQQARKEISHYDRKCRTNQPKNIESAVVRLAVPEEGETIVIDKIRGEVVFQNKIIDDQVLLKSDGFPTYHLASVVDDHLMEISHVIRAEEWLSSTPKHVLLYQAFGWEVPEFAHLPLLRNTDRSKISKRKNPVAVNFYREEGYLPEALINFLGLMGWSHPEGKEIFTLEEMVKTFSFDRVDAAGPIFDVKKLEWLNGEYIRAKNDDDLVISIKDFSKYSPEQIKSVLPLIKERIKKLSEFDGLVSYFFEENISVAPELLTVKGINSEEVKTLLEKLKDSFSSQEKWTSEIIAQTLEQVLSETNLSKTDLYQLVRAVVTGSKASPPLYETVEQIGKDKVLSRLETAAKQLN